jgi:hypothetical protein
VELLRQRSRTNNFNHQKRLDQGQLLGRLVLVIAFTTHRCPDPILGQGFLIVI